MSAFLVVAEAGFAELNEMDQVRPLYAHVQSTVLDSLRREWQRYGWEDSEIDDKVERLSQLWSAALTASGAVPEPGDPVLSAVKEEGKGGEEKKEDGEGGEGKRKRKTVDEAADKRFKSGPRVNAPLTYPTLPSQPSVPTYQPVINAPSAGQSPTDASLSSLVLRVTRTDVAFSARVPPPAVSSAAAVNPYEVDHPTQRLEGEGRPAPPQR